MTTPLLPSNLTCHATGILYNDMGILINGPSGAGKSNLALRLMGLGAQLIADDTVILTPTNNQWHMTSHPRTAGLIEIRGLGLIKRPFIHTAEVDLVINLVDTADHIERYPTNFHQPFYGISTPTLCMWSFDTAWVDIINTTIECIKNPQIRHSDVA